ncbi:hypothetical protein [Brochothrix thermosphacta]|uniref:hypothetical protein n=1 Tax=Brochothrix thermosphacta TaxID=2756 RepID=UPI0003E8622B|nr:hypothetical protein [Brochothrix thermosphacta]EUJ38163.1 hypothetical protein BTHER_02270 [Brochothrix thermosphacta DSM 20171 = FSL F6-1036]ODJ49237.1 hypothetical protein BFR34_06265 [Brochothrix thermosphacta DSM 20171 = FSL F6-1036]
MNATELEKIISAKTNEVYDTGGLATLTTVLPSLFEQADVPLNEKQLMLLNSSSELLAKSITKNTLVATINLLVEIGVLKGEN